MAHVVKIGLNSNSFKSCNIREIFSACGEIRGVYPIESASGCDVVFIDFAEYESVKCALDLHLEDSGIRVFLPSMVPQFTEEYRAANPTASVSPAMLQGEFRCSLQDLQKDPPSEDERLSGSNARRSCSRDKFGPSSISASKARLANSSCSVSNFRCLMNAPTNASDASLSFPFNPAHDQHYQSIGLTETTAGTILHSPTPVDTSSQPTLSSAIPPLIHLEPSKSASAMTVSCLPLTECIHISLCGEIFAYDLDGLQSDPREIVELLRIARSERGNWMVVGAHYRRKGNPRAAITVITALLEVMAEHHIPEQELKPAFLLLSSCETDLGKSMTRDGKEDACEHYRNSQMWLQKVYGTTSSTSSNTASSSSCHTDATQCTPSHLPPRTHSPGSLLSDRSINHEVQSLRKRLHHQTDLLSDTRYSKRRLEHEYDLERNLRRRLERQVDDLQRELDDARKIQASVQEGKEAGNLRGRHLSRKT